MGYKYCNTFMKTSTQLKASLEDLYIEGTLNNKVNNFLMYVLFFFPRLFQRWNIVIILLRIVVSHL